MSIKLGESLFLDQILIPLVELIKHRPEKLLALLIAVNEVIFLGYNVILKEDVFTGHLLKYIDDTLGSQLLSQLLHVVTFEGSAFSNKGGTLVLPLDQLPQIVQS